MSSSLVKVFFYFFWNISSSFSQVFIVFQAFVPAQLLAVPVTTTCNIMDVHPSISCIAMVSRISPELFTKYYSYKSLYEHIIAANICSIITTY